MVLHQQHNSYGFVILGGKITKYATVIFEGDAEAAINAYNSSNPRLLLERQEMDTYIGQDSNLAYRLEVYKRKEGGVIIATDNNTVVLDSVVEEFLEKTSVTSLPLDKLHTLTLQPGA